MTTLHRDKIDGLPDSLLSDCVLAMGKRGGGKSFFFRLAMERAMTWILVVWTLAGPHHTRYFADRYYECAQIAKINAYMGVKSVCLAVQ